MLFNLLQSGLDAVSVEAVPQQQEMTLSFFDLFLKGGALMWVLLALSFVAIYIFGKKWWMIRKAGKIDKNFMNDIHDYLHEGKIKSAVTLCQKYDSPVARLVEKGIERIGRPLSDIQTAVENMGNVEVARLENELLEKENSSRASGDEMEKDLNNLRKEFNATQAENKKLKKEISALENRIHTLEESASSEKPQGDKSQVLIAHMGSREAIELANNAIARAKARGAHHKLTLIFAGMMWLWILFGHDADVFPFNSQ